MTTQKVIVKNQGGIGVSGLLLVVFITLKLCGVIHWPWFWVLAPLWIPFAIFALILCTGLVVALAVTFFEKRR